MERDEAKANSTTCMEFAFDETTNNYCLSLKRIVNGSSAIGTLNSFEYRGLKAPTENDQRVPQLRFNVTFADSNYRRANSLPSNTHGSLGK